MRAHLLVPLIAVSVVITTVSVLTRPDAAAQPLPTCQAPGPTAAVAAPSVNGSLAGVELSPAQMSVAQAIVGAAKGMSITKRGAVIALQTAMQESTLRANARSGRATGAFQQIAPGPYRAYEGYDRTDAAASARGFFTVLVKRVPSYDTDVRSNHELAQVVQASGAGAGMYARWQSFAEAVAGALYDRSAALDCADRSVPGPIPVTVTGTRVVLPPQAGVAGEVNTPTTAAAIAVAAALAYLGTPYAWGGGGPNGPSKGIRDGGVADAHGDFGKVGFDCSGLTEYAWAKAGYGIGGVSRTQRRTAGPTRPWGQAGPGDLLFWGNGSVGAIHHVALFLGLIGGAPYMVEAPQSGDVVKVSRVRLGGDFRDEAIRPTDRAGEANL